MPRLTKIYTRTGDDGYTTIGKERLPKDDLLLEALGTIDELNSCIGFVLSQQINHLDIINTLKRIQNELFDFGGEMHAPQYPGITTENIIYLEKLLDEWNKTLPPLTEFIMPSGRPATAACHIARAVCRRAERCMVRLDRSVRLSNQDMLKYLNRLSDLLFVIARLLAQESNGEEKMWEKKT